MCQKCYLIAGNDKKKRVDESKALGLLSIVLGLDLMERKSDGNY